jgi:two-component system sensor histidine kinase/response regulator
MSSEQASILVVDDTPANLQILFQMLKRKGYRARPVPSGTLALRAVEYEPPDLILMDINMPVLDGISTCIQLKENELYRDIPVIFVSARNDTFDKIKAFKAGGVDYVTKPFDTEEVLSRVETHLKIRSLQQQLQDRNRHLKENYQQLQELEELRDGLVNMVIHDMRSPLSVIRSALGLLQQDLGEQMDAENKEDIEDAVASANTLMTMISNLLDISRMEGGEMPLTISRCDVQEVAEGVLRDLAVLTRNHTVTTDIQTENPNANCDKEVVRRIITNLMTNALKFTQKGGDICLRVERCDNRLEVSVLDSGRGISSEYHEKIFKKFGQSETHGKSDASGLGLTFCKLAVESHGGKIGIESEMGTGSRFWFTLATTEDAYSSAGDACA